MKTERFCIDDYIIEVPLPDGWTITVRNLGWEAWAQSEDKEVGVARLGETEREAVQNLEKSMNEWIDFTLRTGVWEARTQQLGKINE